MLCVCAGMGHIFYQPDFCQTDFCKKELCKKELCKPDGGGLFSGIQKQADYVQADIKICTGSRLERTAAASGTLKDSAAGYIRTVRSSSFMAAHNVNNVAERTPVQYLRTGQITGAQNGHWFSPKRKNIQKTVCNGGVKASLFGTSGLAVPYHKTVSVLNCCHFSKCYILALGRLLC